MIKNPKIGQEVWFFEPWAEDIHSAKITALGETEVSARNPEKYPYADIHWDDGGDSSCLLKDLYASREELQNKLKKEEPVYLYVSKGNLSRMEKWSLNNRFTVEKEFIDGTIFKLEK